MSPQKPNPVAAAHKSRRARNMIRLRDPDTGEFLHLSGAGTTRDISFSWIGLQSQAVELQRRAMAAGEDFPFHAVHRAVLARLDVSDRINV